MMALLVIVAVFCGLGMLGLGGLLGLALERRPAHRAGVAFQRVGSAAAMMARVPAPLFLHPRMDLATGNAPQHQTVDMEQRKTRRQSSEVLVAAAPERDRSTFTPFVQRQEHHQPIRNRLDRVYALDTMGDLSDPVAGSGIRPRAERTVLAGETSPQP